MVAPMPDTTRHHVLAWRVAFCAVLATALLVIPYVIGTVHSTRNPPVPPTTTPTPTTRVTTPPIPLEVVIAREEHRRKRIDPAATSIPPENRTRDDQ